MNPEMSIVYGDVQDEVWMEGRRVGCMYMDTSDGRWYFEGGWRSKLTVSRIDRDDLLNWLMGE